MKSILKTLTKEELNVLYKLFEIKQEKQNIEVLETKIGKLLLPAGGLFQNAMSYDSIISKIAINSNIEINSGDATYEKEKQLFIALFADSYEKMTSQEKEVFTQKLETNGLSKNQVASVTALATLGAAQLSGFGIYLLASSTVGAISSALGLSLSFAFYTSMSSFISLAIGPVGFLIAAIPLVKTFKDVRTLDEFKEKCKTIYASGKTFVSGNYDAAIIVFQYLAGLRIMKVHQAEEEIKNLKNQMLDSQKNIASLHNDIANSLELEQSINREVLEVSQQLETLKLKQREILTSSKTIRESLNTNEETLKFQTLKISEEKSKLKQLKNL